MIVSPCAGVIREPGMNKLEPELTVSLGITDIPEIQKQKELKHSFVKEGNLLFVASAGLEKRCF